MINHHHRFRFKIAITPIIANTKDIHVASRRAGLVVLLLPLPFVDDGKASAIFGRATRWTGLVGLKLASRLLGFRV
jgi:hypothetical protein